jgi:hypothetical protein
VIEHVYLPLEADRYVPWVQSIPILGEAIPTSADLKLGVALSRDAGDPILTLNKAASPATRISFSYSGSDTIANHVAARRLPGVPDGFEEDETQPLTLIDIFALAPSSGWCPVAGERGQPLVLHYDIWITETAFLPVILFTGTLTVLPGVLR